MCIRSQLEILQKELDGWVREENQISKNDQICLILNQLLAQAYFKKNSKTSNLETQVKKIDTALFSQLIEAIDFNKANHTPKSPGVVYKDLASSSSLLLEAFVKAGKNKNSSFENSLATPFNKRESCMFYLSHFVKSVVHQHQLVVNELTQSSKNDNYEKNDNFQNNCEEMSNFGKGGISSYQRFLILREVIYCSLNLIAIKNLKENGKNHFLTFQILQIPFLKCQIY